MSKMAEMQETIEELRSAAAAINDTADWLYQQFSGDEATAPEAPAKAKKEKPKPLKNILSGSQPVLRYSVKKKS